MHSVARLHCIGLQWEGPFVDATSRVGYPPQVRSGAGGSVCVQVGQVESSGSRRGGGSAVPDQLERQGRGGARRRLR